MESLLQLSFAGRLLRPAHRPTTATVVRRVPWGRWLYVLLAVLPLGFVAFQVGLWVRNIPRWDEFDTVLDLLVSLDSGASGREILARIVAVQNEHRMVVSRLLFAASYWLFGGINFAVLAVLGNLFCVAAIVPLLRDTQGVESRLRLAAIFALMVFQLQHHENLFWSGASIDHFFVVLASIAAVAAVTRTGPVAIAIGCGWAFLGTFSLAHGIVVWPVGMAWLCLERRWRAALGWTAAALVAHALFLAHFHISSAHRVPALGDLFIVGRFWLTLIGSSAALCDVEVAPWLGGVFLAVTVFLFRRGVAAPERVGLAAIAWCLGAMGMIAWGRALLSPEWAPLTSRYVILSSVAWAVLVGMIVERALVRSPRRAWWLPLTFMGLVAFNIAADWRHLGEGRVLARSSEMAARSYHRHGTFAKGPTRLYPDTAWADSLIAEAECRELYRLPPMDQLMLAQPLPLTLDEPAEIDDAEYFIEQVATEEGETRVRGWALRPDHTMRRGDLAVVFRSAAGLFAFEPTQRLRPDVAKAYERWDAAYTGFELRLPQAKLPPGTFRIGVCFTPRSDPEYMMTGNTIVVPKQ